MDEYELIIDEKTYILSKDTLHFTINLKGSDEEIVKVVPHEDDSSGFIIVANSMYIITSGLTDKMIKFWKTSDLLNNKLVPHHQYKNGK